MASVLEGVFAIHKPAATSSAQVIRDVQRHFDPSELFKPWIDREQARKNAEHHNQRQKRKWRGRRVTSVKMGHGGTLDPMATGVLILGLGSGTKQLHFFSDECTKSYETVVLFGAATDSYDTEGKIVARKAFDHVTREDVEKALDSFRGKIMQKPPIFSALRMNGKRLYEYAREGKELPKQIEARPVEVESLEFVEWIEGGSHSWHWPSAEAEQNVKQAAKKAFHFGKQDGAEPDPPSELKRQRSEESDNGAKSGSPSSPKRQKQDPDARDVETDQATVADQVLASNKSGTAKHEHEDPVTSAISAEEKQHSPSRNAQGPEQAKTPCPAPACRLRMTVTSGFYVRSLCHDLGAAVGSLGVMAELVRTRQGDFELGTNVLPYDDLEKGEDVWGPKVKGMLENWVPKEKPQDPS